MRNRDDILYLITAYLTPQAADALKRFLDPQVNDPNYSFRVQALNQFIWAHDLFQTPYCCPESLALSLISREPDNADGHSSMMRTVLQRRLPCAKRYVHEWPHKRPVETFFDPGIVWRPYSLIRRLAREMSSVWVVRPIQASDASPFPHIRACVMERA